MRTSNLSYLTIVLCLSFGINASAELLDFAGWDHAQIAGGGQLFEDICGDLDVTVESIGTFDADSTFVMTTSGTMTTAVRSEIHGLARTASFFRFSEPIDAYVELTRVDTEEIVGVFGIGPEAYAHSSGNMPTTAIDGSGMSITGNGFGAAAANGMVSVGPTSVLTVSYQSLTPDTIKYLDFNVGKVVPEPSSAAMLGLAILGLLQGIRRRLVG